MKHNTGISWGVDDLERRRHVVRERCVIAGTPSPAPSLSWLARPAHAGAAPGKSFGEDDTVPLRVKNGRVRADSRCDRSADILCLCAVRPTTRVRFAGRSGEDAALYSFPPRLSIYWCAPTRVAARRKLTFRRCRQG